jgi:hypothetical protein
VCVCVCVCVCSGHPLECVDSYKYLGCVFTDPSGRGGTLGQVN